MTLIGYARVSTDLQNPDLQTDALTRAGCEKIFTDHASGTRADRPQLAALMEYLRAGDILVVWRLDRLGRSVAHLVGLMGQLDARQIGFRSLTETIDTTTPTGRLWFHMSAAWAQFERDLISQRTVAGLAAARARGRTGGRPSRLDDDKKHLVDTMLAEGYTVTAIAKALGSSRATIYRYLPKHDNPSAGNTE